VQLLSWWYSTGWLALAKRVGGRVKSVLDFFSVGLLLGSLFAPFRQISAGGSAQGPLGIKLRAWADRQFSRVIGAVVRLILIICGVALVLLTACVGLVMIIAWPLLPALPVIGLIFSLQGGFA
jgi:hypothetical protein